MQNYNFNLVIVAIGPLFCTLYFSFHVTIWAPLADKIPVIAGLG